jgi:DNA-binding NtrC family response regulator
MAPWDDFEHDEATEAQDLTRLLRALRPPAREVQVPPPVDLTIRAEIWKAPVRRQLSTLLAMARWELIQAIRQALLDNPLLEAVAGVEDEDTLAGGGRTPDLTAAAERYDSIWQACVPEGWDATDLPSQASEAPSASERANRSPEALGPDVIVAKVGPDYQVLLNEEGMPRLRMSATSRRLRGEGPVGEPAATHDLDDKLRAAVWLIRSLEYRRQTLSAIAQSLVTRQRAFLDHGPAHLQPLELTEVAAALGLHASTVRSVVTNKYLATAHGIVALTSCFQSDIKSHGGETLSSLTVKDRIKMLVAAEDPAKPLTDQQLVEALAAEHITIARRTVTQYRRELTLPPANRRQLHGSTAGASRLSPDEEQRVRHALEAHARRRQAAPPPPADASESVLHVQEVPIVRETRMRDISMICQSPKMQEVSRRVERVLQTTATVLIMGEPGTGKGLVARILHDQGSRRQGPFIAVSCTGIPETRLEDELFSHFERAAGGTLFIDGVAEMSPTLQARLLRVLQEKQFERAGGTETLTTDARIIAATHQDLARLMAEGRFRGDLFYRLNVYPITLPPLRERQEDLDPLTMHFLKRFSQALRKEVRGISREAMGWLERYPWPGNVRELAEVIERAVARCQGPTVTTQDLPQALREPSRVSGSSGEAVRRPAGAMTGADLEKQLIQQALEQAHGNKSQAAKILGLSRTQLRLRMRQYGLENG